MLIQEIQTNALDLAGGELIRQKLDTHFATLTLLNIIDTMMLELSNSRKQFRGYKQDFTLAVGVDTGAIDLSAFDTDTKFIRWRLNANDGWKILDVVEEIEDLTRAVNKNERAILFQGIGPNATYFLSWKPDIEISAELWGKQIADEVTDLNDLPPFPPEFSLVATYRLADFCLNQLLMLDAQLYQPFVIAQKLTIRDDQRRVEHFWRRYRAGIPDAMVRRKGEAFNVLDEYDEWDDAEGFTHFLN
jgi:hypothetical protein